MAPARASVWGYAASSDIGETVTVSLTSSFNAQSYITKVVPGTVFAYYYLAMLRRARLCHSILSVCQSVCLCVTFRYRDHLLLVSADTPTRWACLQVCVFARDSICYSAHMLSPVRLSVCPSVTRVDQSKTVEARIMQLSPQSSPMTLVSSWLISARNSKGNIGKQGRQIREG